MNDVLFVAIICIVCFLLYRLLNFLAIKAYRRGYEKIGNIFTLSSFISFILSAICLISAVVVLAKLII